MKKRMISMILAVCMAFTMLPLEAFAAFANEKAAQSAYQDVGSGAWYEDAVRYVSENGLFSGTGGNRFSPNGTMSRAMYVTVIGRMVGVDIKQYAGATAFSDVPADAYYAPYVAWAAKLGITSGSGNGLFDPDGVVTREQMAVFTVRLFDALGYKLPAESISSTPKDFDAVADYAKEAVLRMWRCGMFVGDAAGNFGPRQSALRAEAAAFLMRADKHLIASGVKEKPKPSDKDDDETESTQYTVTFDTKGGAALAAKTVSAGAKLLEQLPTPYKMNAIFAGWYKDAELTQPVTASDTATGNLTLYASYTNADGVSEQETKPFATDLNVSGAWRISITNTTAAMSADAVKRGVAYSCLSNPEYTDMKIESKGEGKYEVYGNGGWPAGSTNKLELLDDKLSFTGKDATTETYNFTIAKEETLDLKLSPTLKELPAGSIQNITQNGAAVYDLSIPLASAKAGLAAAAQSADTGAFTYAPRARDAETIKVGDTVALYEGTPPSERVLNGGGDENYMDQNVAYVTITAVDGDKYSYKAADSKDVMFTPDILPVANNADTDGNPGNEFITVPKTTFDFTADEYAGSGLSAETRVDVGDFILFYAVGTDLDKPGSPDAKQNSYARILSVTIVGDNYTIEFADATQEEVLDAMDLFDNADISGEQLLGDKTTGEIEDSIEREATVSGFAEEAANYLAALALETDGFQSAAGELNLKRYELSGQDAGELSGSRITAMAEGRVKLENLSIKADVRTKLQHFEGLSGLRAALTIGFDVVIAAGENKIVVHVEGTFEEEVRLSMNFSGKAVWKWAWIFPYIADYRMNANVDVYNFTGINVNAVVGTFGKDETPDLDKEDDWDNVALQLKELIEKAEAGVEVVEGIDTMGTSLSDKYSALMDNESDWVELFSVNLTESEGSDPYHILCYGFSADFVVSANMNVSIGFDFYYENGKRYNFTLGLFSKTSQSDTLGNNTGNPYYDRTLTGTVGTTITQADVEKLFNPSGSHPYIGKTGFAYDKLVISNSTGAKDAAVINADGSLLIKLYYKRIQYQQTWNGNGGLCNEEQTVVKMEYFGAEIYPPRFYKTGHEASWPEIEALKKPWGGTPMPANDVETTAVWTPITVKIGYWDRKLNPFSGVQAEGQPTTFTYGQEFELKAPTKEGYTFGGWFTEWACDGTAITTHSGLSDIQLNFYAKWLPDSNSIFYYTGENKDESVTNSNPATYETGAEITLKNPSRSGYTFEGWYTDAERTVAAEIPAIKTTDSGVREFYAKWTAKTYTVKFDANLGAGTAMADLPMTYGTAKNLPANTFIRDGYTFTGWNTKADGTGTSHAAGASVTNLTTTQGAVVTLYAQWGTQSYTITYVPVDGTENTESFPKTYTKVTGNITLGTPTRTGYNFIGWYTDSGRTEANKVTGVAIPQGSTGNKTFYAKWELKTAGITLRTGDGAVDNVKDPTLIHTYNTATPLPMPTWTGHDFLGWYLSSSYEGEAVTEVSATEIWSGTREYFAKWQESGFKVTYEGLNGATNTNPPSYTYHESATITLADPGKREGYTFAGWYNGATQLTAIDRSVMEDITLTAKWTLVQYNITYYGASGHNGVKTYTIEDEVTLTDYVPSSGGTFLGWMTGEYANDPVKGRKIPKGSTGDKIFYVKVLAATGKMFYVMNDGFWDTYTPTPSATRGSEAFLLAEPVRSGFKFYGWYTNPEFTGDPIYSIPASNTDGNKSYVLYARWIANTEVITITDLSQLSQYEGTASKGKYIVIEAPTGNGLATAQTSGTLLTNFYGVIEGAVTGDTTAYLKIESEGATFIKNNYGAVRQIAFIGQYGTSSTSEISGPIVNNHGLVLDCAVNPHYGGYKEACKVYGGEVAGGIVGYNRTTGVVASCNNNAVDIGASEARGGVVGKNDGYVYNCVASLDVGAIDGSPFDGVKNGNIIGINTANGICDTCENNHNIDASKFTEEIVGDNQGTIK